MLCLMTVTLAGCASPQRAIDSRRTLEATIVALANEMAANASALDVRSNLHLIPMTDKVVYVSEGAPITGNEYAKELGASYASRRSISFRWDHWEITPIASNAAVYTGWATVAVTPSDGPPVTGRYIYTMVFSNDGTGWKRVIAHKSRLREDS